MKKHFILIGIAKPLDIKLATTPCTNQVIREMWLYIISTQKHDFFLMRVTAIKRMV